MMDDHDEVTQARLCSLSRSHWNHRFVEYSYFGMHVYGDHPETIFADECHQAKTVMELHLKMD